MFVARMMEARNANRILLGKSLGKLYVEERE
jgi:hypothetical protein